MSERHWDDFGRKVTPRWIAHVVRRRPGLKAERWRDSGHGAGLQVLGHRTSISLKREKWAVSQV
jgi:hypothetical protein